LKGASSLYLGDLLQMKIRLFFLMGTVMITACRQPSTVVAVDQDSLAHCASKLPSRFGGIATGDSIIQAADSASHLGMVWIKGGSFMMGAHDQEGREDEYPAHSVTVNGFWMQLR
jgi:formylglycine-generating enzyme